MREIDERKKERKKERKRKIAEKNKSRALTPPYRYLDAAATLLLAGCHVALRDVERRYLATHDLDRVYIYLRALSR